VEEKLMEAYRDCTYVFDDSRHVTAASPEAEAFCNTPESGGLTTPDLNRVDPPWDIGGVARE